MSDDPRLPSEAQIAEWRQQHIGRLFLRAHRDFSARAIKKVHARGHHALGPAHLSLIPHVDVEGTRITTLAERAGITKQSVGQLVAELEQEGYLERITDPADRRAAIVKFTEAGWGFLREAYEIKHEIEAEYVAILGEARMEMLRDALTRLLEGRDPGEET